MLELDIIKQHVRLEPDFEDDDTLLDTYSNAARRLVENRTGRKLYATAAEFPKDGDGNPTDENALVLDDDLVTAMLLLIGSVTGAQIGTRLSMKLRPEYLRVLLAAIVLLVAARMALGLGWRPDEIFTIEVR